MKYIKFLSLMIVAALGLMMTGCSDDDNPLKPKGKSNIRVIHTSYDAPAVDVAVDNKVAITALAYGKSSGYAEIDFGTRNIKVTPAGATSPVVIEANLSFEKDKDYTVFAVNPLGSIDAVVATDDRMMIANKAKIRFLHAAPDAPAVDIRLGNGSGPAVFGNVAFKSITSYLQVDAGSYIFAVTPAGSNSEVVVFNPITAENGKVYTVVAHGTLNPADNYPFAVRIFIDDGAGNAFADMTAGTSQVIVTHASPDAPGVDLLVDNTVVNSSALTFPNSTGYLTVSAGSRNIKVNASGTPTTVINADLGLAPLKAYSIFAVDRLANISALVLEDDLTQPAAGKAHVRFVHLSPDAPAVDVTLTNGTIVFGNKSFKQFTSFTPLNAGSYDLQVRLAGTSTVVLNLPGIMLESGKIYTVFAKGFVAGSDQQALGAIIILNK